MAAGNPLMPNEQRVEKALKRIANRRDTLLRQFQREVLAVGEEGLNAEALPRSPGS